LARYGWTDHHNDAMVHIREVRLRQAIGVLLYRQLELDQLRHGLLKLIESLTHRLATKFSLRENRSM
jgi:hypothetical protein